MNCPKCSGYMILDPPMDFYMTGMRWRCVNCGTTRETIASMLRAHKRAPKPGPHEQYTIHNDGAIRGSRS